MTHIDEIETLRTKKNSTLLEHQFSVQHFATAKLVQFLKNLNLNHLAIANRVIVYLNDIRNLVIEFSRNFSEIFLYANDVAFADNELIKKSSDDYFFKLYDDSID